MAASDKGTVDAPDKVRRLTQLDPIGFNWRTGWTDRGIAVGGTGSGKSVLCEHVNENALERYPTLRVLYLDTKPRFRAQYETSGISAARRYKNWDHGEYIEGSYALPLSGRDAGLADAIRLNARVIIAQSEHSTEWPRLLDAATAFYMGARASEPRLIYVDEVMDFFSMGGHPIGKNPVLLQTARAGRERGLGLLIASQRPRHMPTQLVQEANKLYLFKLRNINDIDHLEEFGTPQNLEQHVPTEQHWFWYYDHENPQSAGRFKLTNVD